MGWTDMIPGVSTLKMVGVGLGVAGVVALIAGGWGHHRGYVSGKAEIQAIFDKKIQEHDRAALKATLEYKVISDQRKADRESAQLALRAKDKENDRTIAEVRAAYSADVIKLRNAFAAAAAHSGGAAAGNTSTPGSDESAALAGSVLGEALQVASELARDAESNADAYRAMLASWPRNPSN